MNAATARQELDRVRQFLKDLEDGRVVVNLRDEAGRFRLKVDEVLRFVKSVKE